MPNGNLIIKNATQLVTPNGFEACKGSAMSELTVIENAMVVIENGLIKKTGVGFDIPDDPGQTDYTVIDAAGKTVLPGFVDAHTHFLFAGHRPREFEWRLSGTPYMEIMRRGGGIADTVSATRSAGRDELLRVGTRRLDAMMAMGVTTVEGKSGYGLDLETEIKQLDVMAQLNDAHPLDIVPTFLGAHAVPIEYQGRPDAYIDYLIETVLPVVTRRNLARFCDIFCEKGIFSVSQSRKLLQNAKASGLSPKLHADEIAPIGGAELAAELAAVSADHLLQASDQGIQDMAQAGVVATLLPGTAFSLREPYPRSRFMIESGCAVALATDFNPGSCFSFSIPLILALATLQMGLTPAEALTAITLNGAAALGRAETTGSLDAGKAGDLILLSYPSYLFLFYHTGVNIVEKVIKDGNVVVDRQQV